MGPNTSVRRLAFTLIELLVVVSIIALLIAILLPGLAQARRQAKSVVCGTNISGISKSILVYTSESDDRVPWNGLILPKVVENGFSRPYPTTPLDYTYNPIPAISTLENNVLMQGRYVTNKKNFICPDDDLTRKNGGALQFSGNKFQPDATGVVSRGAGGNGYWSYSVNSVLNSAGQARRNFIQTTYPPGGSADTAQPWADPLKMTTVRSPSTFIMLVEEASDSNFNDEVFDPISFNAGDAITDRHNHSGNLGFGDGHVEPVNATLFNLAGTTIADSSIASMRAVMNSPQGGYTRQFFPDGGDFLGGP